MNIPYTYLIGWSEHNTWYYGVRFAANCSPDDLWVSYFTSSNYVKEFREQNGEPDVIRVRKTFDDSQKARDWESKVIDRIGMVENNNWLNLTNGTNKFYHEGPRGSFTKEHKMKLSEAKKGSKICKEHAKKLHEGRRNSKNSDSHKEALLRAHLGSKRSIESRKKMSNSRMSIPLEERKRLASIANKGQKYLNKNGINKKAIPNSDKWNKLISEGWKQGMVRC